MQKKEKTSFLKKLRNLDFNKTHITIFKILEKRTGYKLNSNENMMFEDIKFRFPDISTHELSECLKNGGLGVYGEIFGNRITSLIVCTWISKYLDDKNGVIIKPEPKQVFIVKK